MLVRDITYKNYNDEEITQTFHFHFSRREIMRMEAEHRNGIQGKMKEIILESERTGDRRPVLDFFENLILDAYGVRPEDDPEDFQKSDELRDKFKRSPAFDQMLWQTALNVDGALINFVKGTFPEGFVNSGELEKVFSDDSPEMQEARAQLAALDKKP